MQVPQSKVLDDDSLLCGRRAFGALPCLSRAFLREAVFLQLDSWLVKQADT